MAKPVFATDKVAAANLLELVPLVDGAIVTKTLVQTDKTRLVLFAMDQEMELTEHRSPYMALLQVLDGKVFVKVNGSEHHLEPHDWLLMPPDAPHNVRALAPTRFLLTMTAVG